MARATTLLPSQLPAIYTQFLMAIGLKEKYTIQYFHDVMDNSYRFMIRFKDRSAMGWQPIEVKLIVFNGLQYEEYASVLPMSFKVFEDSYIYAPVVNRWFNGNLQWLREDEVPKPIQLLRIVIS